MSSHTATHSGDTGLVSPPPGAWREPGGQALGREQREPGVTQGTPGMDTRASPHTSHKNTPWKVEM